MSKEQKNSMRQQVLAMRDNLSTIERRAFFLFFVLLIFV